MNPDSDTIISSMFELAEREDLEGSSPSLTARDHICGFGDIQEITDKLQEAPYSTVIICQLLGFEGEDQIAWIEIMETDCSSRLVRHLIDQKKWISKLVIEGYLASRLCSMIFQSLPGRWRATVPMVPEMMFFAEESDCIGPLFMFDGQSALFWIKRESDIHCFEINFYEDRGEGYQVKRLLSKIVRYGPHRLWLLCLLDTLKGFFWPQLQK